MNDLLKAMSTDMNIHRYRNESDESFTYRLCYSALGQWCLKTAMNTSESVIGTTKHNQTIVLNDLQSQYCKLFPNITDRLVDDSGQQVLSVAIRRIYEETGYLLTDSENHNRIATFGRTIRMGDKFLFFGLPSEPYEVNGLGVFSNTTHYSVVLDEFLIRDSLSPEDYFQRCFDPIDFYDRDIDLSELEFFDPLSRSVPSLSWVKEIATDCTVARKTEIGPFYRVMRLADGILFADEPIETQSDSFISYDYRRLYYALKMHYNRPLEGTITKIDNMYSRLQIRGLLPNREYYLTLLLSWPERSAFDKSDFIIRNNLLIDAVSVLTGIGIQIRGGQPSE